MANKNIKNNSKSQKIRRENSKSDKNNKSTGINKKYKIAGIVAIMMIIVFLACIGIYRLNFDNKAKNEDITLEKLRQGGAIIYDSKSEVYTTLDIGKCGRWIPIDELWETLKNVDEAIGKDYANLIVDQFYDDNEDKELLARALEIKYSENELAEFFLNTVYLGDGVFGVTSATKRFFGCEYEFVSDNNKETLKDIIYSYIESERYSLKLEFLCEDSVIYDQNSYIDGVVKETVRKLMRDGVDEKTAFEMIYRGNLHIYTYMDTEISDIVNKAYNDKTTFTKDKSDNRYIQSAMVVMDDQGKIKAVAGGNNGDKIINRAVSSNYQIGSTMKPISTYSLGIEGRLIHYSTMIEDVGMYITNSNGEEIMWPSNHDGNYEGFVTVSKALQQSKNTVAVRTGIMVGEDKIYKFLEDKLGYNLVAYENNNTDKQLSALTLGYLYKGIPLTKLAASYEMFSNGGLFYDSAMVSCVKNSNGEIILKDNRGTVQALSPQTAYIVNRLLYDNVNGEYGIAKKASIENVEVLGKTGTTGDDNGNSISRMFVGVTSDYIVGVWIGYDDKLSLSLKPYNTPAEIYSNVISRLEHSDDEFNVPEGIVVEEFCELTGGLATENCHKKSTGYYTKDNIPADCPKCGK